MANAQLLNVASQPLPPLTAAKIVGPQATVLLLITLLIKAQVQIKAASAWDCSCWPETLVFVAAAGGQG
ncbi:MAG: hypothetical protein NTZ40_00245 [Cyanobacteria bacterium]|nr:hypothetical protein [Cyanobacteriota bacterium]